MARLIKLDALVPEDIVFELRGEKYAIPGDPDLETILRIAKLAQADENDDLEAQESAAESLRDELLSLFRVRQPELERLPVGVVAMQHVVRVLLEELGMLIAADESEEDPTPATPPKQAGSRKSARSSGSRRS